MLRIRPLFCKLRRSLSQTSVLSNRQRQAQPHEGRSTSPQYVHESENYDEPRMVPKKLPGHSPARNPPSIALQMFDEIFGDAEKPTPRDDTQDRDSRSRLEALKQSEDAITKHLEHFSRVSQKKFKPSVGKMGSKKNRLSLKDDYSELYNEVNFSKNPDESTTSSATVDRTGDVITLNGTPNPAVRPSTVKCGGCGAKFQCRDSSLPGRFRIFGAFIRILQ